MPITEIVTRKLFGLCVELEHIAMSSGSAERDRIITVVTTLLTLAESLEAYGEET